MHILTARWAEPCSGSAAWTVDLDDEEAARIQSILDWLKEHAKEDYGDTLAQWELHPSRAEGRADLESLDEAISEIALNSRYNETGEPGDYYGARHPDLDGH